MNVNLHVGEMPSQEDEHHGFRYCGERNIMTDVSKSAV